MSQASAETIRKHFPRASADTIRLNSAIPPMPAAAIVAKSVPTKAARANAAALAEARKAQGMAVSGAVSMSGEGHWRLTLPYPPSANRYWRTVVCKNRAIVFVSTEAKQYKATVAQLTGAMLKLTGPIGMRVHVYRPQRSGDLGNRIKVLEDALQGVVYENDSQIEYEELFRHDDKANPRVEVELWCLPSERQAEMPI